MKPSGNNYVKLLRVLFGIMISVLSISNTPILLAQNTDDSEPRHTIVIGEIDNDPEKKIRQLQPLADYLAENLSAVGIMAGEVRIAPDLDTMISWFEQGEIDLYFDSLYPALLVSDATDAQPILRRWKDGVGEYHSIFFTLPRTDYTSVADLQGGLVALDEPVSTSGFLVPISYLIQQNLTVVERSSSSASVAADEIGYVFSGDDENTIQWVFSRRVRAGVVDSETFRDIPENVRSQIVILAETDPVPRQVTLASPHLPPEMIETLTTLLLELDETDEGLDILDRMKTSRFDELPTDFDDTLADMRVLIELVQDNE